MGRPCLTQVCTAHSHHALSPLRLDVARSSRNQAAARTSRIIHLGDVSLCVRRLVRAKHTHLVQNDARQRILIRNPKHPVLVFVPGWTRQYQPGVCMRRARSCCAARSATLVSSLDVRCTYLMTADRNAIFTAEPCDHRRRRTQRRVDS